MNRILIWIILGILNVGVATLPAHGATNLALLSRTIVWQPGLSPDLIAQLSQPPGQLIPALVHFKQPLTAANHAQLTAAGVVLEEFLADNSYVALLPTQTFLTNASAQSLVHAAILLLPLDRISPSLAPVGQVAINAGDTTIRVMVSFWRSVPVPTVASNLSVAGLTGSRYGAHNSWVVTVPVASFAQTVSNFSILNLVRFIEPGPPPFKPLNNMARAVVGTDLAQDFNFDANQPIGAANPKYARLSGAGIKIAICDDGFKEDHNDFRDVGAGGAATGTRVYHSRGEVSDHGTAVASIAAGNGFESLAYNGVPFLYRGHAPHAGLGDYTNIAGELENSFKALNGDGSDICNHSYLQSYTHYDGVAESLDDIVRGTAQFAGQAIRARPSVWGAGNNATDAQYTNIPGEGEIGYYSVFTSAKNTISVGSIDTSTLRRSPSSSLGPTFDGRIKPDVVAPGNRDPMSADAIMAANSVSGQPVYKGFRGTSMAAPVVSGIIALMMEHYRNTCASKCMELQPALYKAILIHTAKDLQKPVGGTYCEDVLPVNPDTLAPTSYGAGPDFATGYGLVDAPAACTKIGQFDMWVQGFIPNAGAVQEWCVQILNGTLELKLVIAWDDYPGAQMTAPTVSHLVNDLDLVLIDPDGIAHDPWTLKPLPIADPPDKGLKDPITTADVTSAVPGKDHLNNVEMVSVSLPKPGIWRVLVTGFQLPYAEGQSYSLVSSHPVSTLCMPPDPPKPKLVNLCKLIPEICYPRYIWPRRLVPLDKGFLGIPAENPIPMDEICNYVLNCPGCGTDTNSLCPGYTMTIAELPPGFRVFVFDQEGKILEQDSSGRKIHRLKIPARRWGDRIFFAAVPTRGEKPTANLRLKFAIERPFAGRPAQ